MKRSVFNKIILQLDRCLEKGKISNTLRRAIKEIKLSMKVGDLSLAYQLSVCKSYIIANIDHKDKSYYFQEDRSYNEEVLGRSIYSILDDIHFDISMSTKKIPSGMILV